MRQKAVTFQASGLNFEGVVTQPDEGAALCPGVVICHPGPLNGGNMDNNVVMAVAMGLVDRGIASIRFNFRGVGNSQGTHAKGENDLRSRCAGTYFDNGDSYFSPIKVFPLNVFNVE